MKFGRTFATLISSVFLGLLFSQDSVAQTPQPATQSHDKPVEVFQILELPLHVQDAFLTKTRQGYLFKCSLSNSSELKMIGLRYSLIVIDSMSSVQMVTNRTEGLSLAAYATKSLTLKTPIKLKLRDGDRLVMMLEQAIAPESIWEVVKAKDALEAYLKGDYSVVPRVMRVANQVDAPLPTRVIY